MVGLSARTESFWQRITAVLSGKSSFHPAITTLYGLYVKDRSRLVITGARGVVLTTNNGGDKWVLRQSGVRDHLFAVTFAPKNPLLGWAVGTFGSIIATTDGGKTWKTQPSQTSSHLFSVSFADAKNGIAVGSHGTILVTDNRRSRMEGDQETD